MPFVLKRWPLRWSDRAIPCVCSLERFAWILGRSVLSKRSSTIMTLECTITSAVSSPSPTLDGLSAPGPRRRYLPGCHEPAAPGEEGARPNHSSVARGRTMSTSRVLVSPAGRWRCARQAAAGEECSHIDELPRRRRSCRKTAARPPGLRLVQMADLSGYRNRRNCGCPHDLSGQTSPLLRGRGSRSSEAAGPALPERLPSALAAGPSQSWTS